MGIIFTKKTQMIFFDLEFIPKGHRDVSLPSLRYNPFNSKHKFLGGVFEKQYPKDIDRKKERKEFWLWDNDDDEKQLIQMILNYFKESWHSLERETPEHMDLITCGIGIARTDIPVLLSVALKHKIANEEEIFEYLAKTKILDFADMFIPYTKSSQNPIYPVTKDDILDICEIESKYDTGKLRKIYKDKEVEKIEKRCNIEVNDLIKIYGWVQKDISEVK